MCILVLLLSSLCFPSFMVLFDGLQLLLFTDEPVQPHHFSGVRLLPFAGVVHLSCQSLLLCNALPRGAGRSAGRRRHRVSSADGTPPRITSSGRNCRLCYVARAPLHEDYGNATSCSSSICCNNVRTVHRCSAPVVSCFRSFKVATRVGFACVATSGAHPAGIADRHPSAAGHLVAGAATHQIPREDGGPAAAASCDKVWQAAIGCQSHLAFQSPDSHRAHRAVTSQHDCDTMIRRSVPVRDRVVLSRILCRKISSSGMSCRRCRMHSTPSWSRITSPSAAVEKQYPCLALAADQ